jgi:uncharacterized protein YdeI (YjbR/CyaY-like superfamily)
MKTLELFTRSEWRVWLAENHDKVDVIWLVHYKKHTGKPNIPYDDTVEEALCYGWIDSTVRRLDEERYAQKFTPRREKSVWSDLNKKRVARLIKSGSMTEHGRKKVDAAKRSGMWDKPIPRPQLTFEMQPEFERALKRNKRAREFFEALAPSYRRQYLGWVETAKRPETKAKRIKESVQLLAKGIKLGMK